MAGTENNYIMSSGRSTSKLQAYYYDSMSGTSVLVSLKTSSDPSSYLEIIEETPGSKLKSTSSCRKVQVNFRRRGNSCGETLGNVDSGTKIFGYLNGYEHHLKFSQYESTPYYIWDGTEDNFIMSSGSSTSKLLAGVLL